MLTWRKGARFSSPGSGDSRALPWKMRRLAFAVAFAGLASTSAQAYPDVVIENTSEYSVSGTVHYGGSGWGIFSVCKNDNFTIPGKVEGKPNPKWSHSRGACLITGISGSITPKHGESGRVVSYDSTGTGYSGFLFAAYGGAYRFFSYTEYNKVTDTRQGKSPGFYLVNETTWPIAYSLDQVGCLYHGIVPTGTNGSPGIMKVDTGAVWFTLRAHIQPDGQNPQSDWDCVQPVAELVGDVLMAAASGGSAAAAKMGGKLIIKQVLKETLKAGLKKAGKEIAKSLLKDIAKEELGRLMKESGSIELYGQYAGYEWPFRCDNMPEYHITGGPELLKDENGEIYIADGPIFTVTKTNSCGNDMMLGSRKSQSAGRSFFASYDNPAAVATGNAGAGGAATQWKVGDIAEVKTPRDTTWRIATVQNFHPSDGILIIYSDTGERNWMPEKFMRPAPPGTVVPGAPGGVASQWKAGDMVEVQRPADGRWTPSSVLNVDPISGVFIRYQDSGEQMWVPQTIVRAPQQAAPGGVASQWKAGDMVEVQRPADGRWTPSSVLNVDPINGVFIRYQDTGEQMWAPQTIVRAPQQAAPGGVASQWKAGDMVEVQRPADGRWTPSSVLNVDPINGVFIRYQDSGEQMWVPQTIVRASQQAAPGGTPAGGVSQWNVGDTVEVQRPGDGQWTVSSVMALDPINGVLITYQDSGQQMWVPETIVRGVQVASAPPTGQPDPGPVQPTPQDAAACQTRSDMAATLATMPTNVSFTNSGTGDMLVYWINAQGQDTDLQNQPQPVLTVPAGQSMSIQTYVGYAFVIKDAAQTCLSVVNAGPGQNDVAFAPNVQGSQIASTGNGTGQPGGQGGGADPRSSKDYGAVAAVDKTWCVDNWGAEGTSPYYECMDQMIASIDPNAASGGNAAGGTQGGADPRSSKDYGAVAAVDKTWCVDNWGAEGTSPYYECMDQMIAMIDPNAAAGGAGVGGAPGAGADPRASKDYSAVQDIDKTWCVDNWGAEGTSPYYECMDQMIAMIDPNAAAGGNAGSGTQGGADPRSSKDYGAVAAVDKTWCVDNWGAEGTAPYYDCMDQVVASLDPNAAAGGNQGGSDPRASNDYSAVDQASKTWCVDNWGAEGTSPYYDCLDQVVASVDPNAGDAAGAQDNTDWRSGNDYSAVDQASRDWCVANWGAEGTSPYYDCLDQMVANLTASQGQQQTYDDGQQQSYDEGQQDYQDEQQQTDSAAVNEDVYNACLNNYPDPQSADFANCYWANN
jgi:hypothetical protein